MKTTLPTYIRNLAHKAKDALKLGVQLGVPSALLLIPNAKLLTQEPMHTISKQILTPDALAPGAREVEIPFKTLDGSLKIKGNVNEEGKFSLTEMAPSQKITLDSASNIISFFTDSTENPLKFRIIEASADSIKLEPIDSLAAWREITLANGNQIKGVLTNSSPHFPVLDTNLSKWNSVIEKVEAKGAEGSSVFNIKFERNTPFLVSDTLFLPVNQVYLDQKMVRGAVIGVKIIDEFSFSRAAYNYKQCGWCYPTFLFQDTLVGPSLDFKVAIKDKENRGYDSLLATTWKHPLNGYIFPLRLIYPIVNPEYTWFKNDPPRLNVSNGKQNLNSPDIPCPDSVWFKGGGVALRSGNGDAISIQVHSNGGGMNIPNISAPVPSLFPVIFFNKNGNQYTIKDNAFVVYESYLENGKTKYKVIDTTATLKNHFGMDLLVNSKDSITFMPTDAKYMAQLLLKATNNFQKGNPYQTIKTELLHSYPEAKAIDVPTDTSLYFKFNKLIENYNITVRAISSEPIDSTSTVFPYDIEGSIFFDKKDSSIKFIPNEKLAYETLHRINLNATGFDKEALDTAIDFTTKDTPVSVHDSKYSNIARELLFPNPAENSTTLKIELEKGQEVELKLYDTYGNEKTVYYNKFMQKGEHNIPIDLNGLSSGAYLIRESRSGKTRKLIKR
ncbi:hypothetical protein COU37_02475 [Candidatus Micrarchaeota archaeon CG10_big_fil_rev_8_21_14_0_10_45_29]|nr:MAG: hypothetical protein COU37_02475 [Candidatus Micrarchaeota archaeon CG10_big_fil_rev_8_21_14_0_10_45_29]